GFFVLGPPPPLVIVGPNGRLIEQEPATSSSGDDRRSPSPSSSFSSQSTTERDIEPAFLNEEDYPPGWMVYHAELGVVPKEEADAYDAMLRRKQEAARKLKEENEDEKKSAQGDEVEASVPPSATAPSNNMAAETQRDPPLDSSKDEIVPEPSTVPA
ncbi:MAG: hypothetical protein SGARI_003446, partial [Bacillariaceae sp.]